MELERAAITGGPPRNGSTTDHCCIVTTITKGWNHDLKPICLAADFTLHSQPTIGRDTTDNV